MIKKLRRLSIKSKLFLLVVFFIFFPFLFFGFLWYSQSTKLIEKTAKNYSEQLVQQQNHYLEYYFGNLERLTFPVVTHPVIQDFILLGPDDKFQSFILSKRIEEEISPELYGRGDIYSFNVASENGVATSRFTAEKFKRYSNEDSPQIRGFSLREVHTDNIDSIPVITLTRSFLDSKTYSTNAMLIIDLKMKVLKEISEQTRLGKTGFIWITDEEGRILYHPTEEKIGKKVSGKDSERIFTYSKGTYIEDIEGEKTLITYHQSPLTNLIIVAEVPLKELIGELGSIRGYSITIGIILITTALLLVGGFSLSLTKSLTNLKKLMKKAEEGDFTKRSLEKREDEIGEVNRSFNKMVQKLQQLVDVAHRSEIKQKEMEIKQRDSTLKAMQSQINPHFLYNTLELINSHAIMDDNSTISRMATSLADLFRYNISNQSQFVTLYEEMQQAKAYMDIQQERYPGLKVDMDYDVEILKKVKAVRIILQPLIENAFEHGYENHKLKPSYLEVKGFVKNRNYYLNIRDNGRGMTADIKNKYESAFSIKGNLGLVDEVEKNDIKRIGLWNVHSRIRLTFGDQYGLKIVRTDESGTTIQIELPMEE
ncbi:sensor histidine kinase [Pontibacillus marinus]|uniref:HAMP domain-containing protein n=1 Tax=Pontibacillus marinus BH030004 = DSM 16465 TaxID=1385511 RepID=A0A0A5FUX8_9BACI|nr:histidine kinase [Pontibacillus marinus]KGX84571.1 hypothetical protein N783_16670 [Pontibacillus marinus BH030004 = DSM 16465]